MDLEVVEKMLYQKIVQAKIKRKATISYNLLTSIIDLIDKLHKYNEMQNMYDNMYKSNVEMASQIKQLKDDLRKANELRSKTRVGKLEQKHKSALRYLRKATWIDTKERNDLESILEEDYDRPN